MVVAVGGAAVRNFVAGVVMVEDMEETKVAEENKRNKGGKL